jgi:prepilin-type N-terminal cleavage/methylation domain-containing protein
MNRSAFTLVELMISVALTAIVLLFLYRALDVQRISNETASRSSKTILERTALYKLLYADLIEAKWIKREPLSNKDYSLLFMRTSNSLHQIPLPYVVYFVHENNRTLVRLESAYELKFPISGELVKYVFADKLLEKVRKFVVLERGSKQKRKKASKEYLLFLKWDKENMVMDVKKE